MDIQGGPKQRIHVLTFGDNFGKCTPILVIFTVTTRNFDAQTQNYLEHLTFILVVWLQNAGEVAEVITALCAKHFLL